MSLLRVSIAVAILSVVALSVTGCGNQYIRADEIYQNDPGFNLAEDAEIPDTTESRKALDVLARYRQAVVQKDFGTLNRLVAQDYYDNAGTTDTTDDDYDAEHLSEVFELMAKHTESITYKVMVKGVTIQKDRAFVDYEYEYSYQYKFGEESQWDAGVDVNRLELVQLNGNYKIVSGL